MAFIEVNHKTILIVAKAVDTYCSAQKEEMKSADKEIKSMLLSDWIGEDAAEFSRKWEGVDDDDSTSVKFKKSLENFSEGLKSCAELYKNAQIKAYNAANNLKWSIR